MAWRTNRGMQVLINQLDDLHPGCEIGTIGDVKHATENPSSDHNPKKLNGAEVVNACDPMVRTSEYPDRLTLLQIDKVVDAIVASRDSRIKYIIWQRHIIAGNDGPQPWVWRNYTRSDPHTGHAHISVEDKADKNTKEWSIGEMALSESDINKVAEKAADKVLAKLETAYIDDDHKLGFQARRIPWAYPAKPGMMAIDVFNEMADDVKAIKAKVDEE